MEILSEERWDRLIKDVREVSEAQAEEKKTKRKSNEEFYKKFLDYLVSEIDGLWYNSYSPSKYSGFDETATLHSWGYIRQTMDEEDIEDQYVLESYQELTEDIVKYLKVVK